MSREGLRYDWLFSKPGEHPYLRDDFELSPEQRVAVRVAAKRIVEDVAAGGRLPLYAPYSVHVRASHTG
jgi:hypothetical protein